MVRTLKDISKKLIVLTLVIITLVIFMMQPIAMAAQLPKDGEFYYAGTQNGVYVVTEGIWSWLLSHLKDIVDWILGFMTMGVRMSIVGWTTIFEWLLTRTLESSVGASYSVDALSSTSVILDSVTSSTSAASSYANDSSSNVTVEAIVYNKVPIFNINFFDTKWDDTLTGTGRDLKDLICKRCKMKEAFEGNSGELCSCTEKECKCTACRTYRAYKAQKESGVKTVNAITIIKETVAQWYYTIRLIAVAAMLLVLIVIGIKIGVSSLASEKAVYKRMLVDWLVGFIFLFGIQYVMFFIINLNELMVKQIADYAKNADNIATEVTKKEFNIKDKTNEALEISIYEAVRTRAYDPKLINGTTGTIMYLTLVVFAIRFSWMYIKRYFTLIVLTLMAPGVAFSYAIQKVFSGKAKAWSTWMQEYIVNVFIQVVHAIIYASFVSICLLVSLNSISGMIIALIIMNQMLKVDKVFRKIFKMSSDGSLLDRVSKGAEQARLANISKQLQGAVVAAKPIANIASKSPAAALARTAIKGVGTGALLAGASLSARRHNNENNPEGQDGSGDGNNNQGGSKFDQAAERVGQFGRKVGQKASSFTKAVRRKFNKNYDAKQEAFERAKSFMQDLTPEGVQRHSENLAQEESQAFADYLVKREDPNADSKDVQNAYIKYEKARMEREAVDRAAKHGGTLSILRDKLNDVQNVDRYFEKDENGKYVRRKTEYRYNPETDSIEKIGNSERLGQALKENFSFSSEEEKKAVAEAMKYSFSGLVGAGAIFAGVGILVSSPGLGFALIGYGTGKNMKLLKPNRNIRAPKSEYGVANKNYYNMRYSPGALNLMKASLLDIALQEVEDIRNANEAFINAHPDLFEKYRQGLISEETGSEEERKFVANIRERRNSYNMAMKKYNNTQRVKGIVEKMYGQGIATDQRGVIRGFVSNRVNSIAGGLGEKLDAVAEAHEKAILQQYSTFEADIKTLQVNQSVGATMATATKLDELQEKEDHQKEGITIFETEDKRTVYKKLPKNINDLVKEAIAELKAKGQLKGDNSPENLQANKVLIMKMVLSKANDMKMDILNQANIETGTTSPAIESDKSYELLSEFKAHVEKMSNDKAFIESEVTNQLKQQIDREIFGKLNQAVDKAMSEVKVEDDAIIKKRDESDNVKKYREGSIDNEADLEAAAKDYQLTREERDTVAEVVKEKIHDNGKINSIKDLEKKEDELAKELRQKNGALSENEAKLQVKAFMNELNKKDNNEDKVKTSIKKVATKATENGTIAMCSDQALDVGKKTELVSKAIYESLSVEADRPVITFTRPTKKVLNRDKAVEEPPKTDDYDVAVNPQGNVTPNVNVDEDATPQEYQTTINNRNKADSLTKISMDIMGDSGENLSPDIIRERDQLIASLIMNMSDIYKVNKEAASFGKPNSGNEAGDINPLNDYKQYVKVESTSDYKRSKKAYKAKKTMGLYNYEQQSGDAKQESIVQMLIDDPETKGPIIGLKELVSRL